MNARLEQIAAQMDELKDEYGGDEGLLAEVIDNEKISKGAVQKRIKEVKGDVDYADELKVLEQYFGLFEKTAEIAQQIKDGEKVLEQKVITKYPSLSHKDIKGIVVDHKWMDALEASVIAEVDRLSQGLAGRLKELAERYRETLPQIEHEVEIMTAKIGQHLESMGFSI